VVSNTNLVENTFTSSGTTGTITSKHLVTDTIYTESYPKDFSVLWKHRRLCSFGFTTILPGKGRIALIYMVEDLIQLSNHDESGFYLHNHDELIKN
jgi:hypothetical protein